MRWKSKDLGANMIIRTLVFIVVLAIGTCDGARRPAQRRKDTSRSDLYEPAPSPESLQVIAQAMGAAGFEHYTEGRPLVKRLIPADSQPDLDVVEHQGVIGKAGVDFPAYPTIPNTGFNCKNVPTGYYADLETDCQVFHICDTSRKISFLCPNGTIFSQSHLICDWWFKVDCASAPALYESSAEYYSNEQKKTQKITQSLSKNPDLQQIGTDTNIRAEPRTGRTSINVPSTTERLLRHRQRLQNDGQLSNSKATARSFQALFETNFTPTQRTQATTAFEKRRKNLVQLIANNFGNLPTKTTLSTYTAGPVYQPTTPLPAYDYNSIREMQVAAETASFAANNNNRQFLQDYNKNYRPYPVYTPNAPKPNQSAPKPNTTVQKPKPNPHLTTLYNFRDRTLEQANDKTQEWTTKRSTLVPYNKPYTTPNHDRRDPYTRPGISLLKDFLEKEKNKTLETSTEKVAHATATDRSDRLASKENLQNKVTIETKNTYESATKIPTTTRSLNYASETASSDKFETHTTPDIQVTTDAYQERRERLIRKLNLGTLGASTTITTEPTTERFYGDLPNRPGLVVPPSLTPKTLHSLAIYYATALDNLSTTATPDEGEVSTPAFDEYEPLEEELPGLFSRHTINKYSSLFGSGHDNSELLEDIKLDPNGTYNELAEDLSVQQSQNGLATSPQIRELAQVFTHALSAYLQDPVQFRKALSDIRPTHPSFSDMLTTEEYNTEPTTTINEEDEEILGFSDDIKSRPALTSLRDPKALNIATIYPTIADEPTTTTKPITTTEVLSTAYSSTPRNPFRCCAKISASYTTASTPISITTTPAPYTNTEALKVNTLANNYLNEKLVATTENSYDVPKYGGFQNNTFNKNSPYGTGVSPTNSQPLNEYVEVTNLPTAWGVDTSETYGSTIPPVGSTDNSFESKKIRITTITPETTPVYFTETDSVELENEEELQRAHSQSFISPQGNSLRQGKQLQFETGTTVKKPSEELEAPTISERITTTVVPTTRPQPTTTIRVEEVDGNTTPSPILSEVFTSPDSDKTTSQFQWPSTFDAWHSTVIDPITLNDGLSVTGAEQAAQVAHQTNAWAVSTTSAPEYTGVSEQTVSPTINVELTTPGDHSEDRFGRLLRDPTSTEPAQDISAITDTVVEKAKEIMEGMNSTTTEKLMNVMKKTKSKTVRRLILLLVQTCDDDHNTTAEASKRALLEALMAVSQKDMEEIAKEEEQSEFQTTVPDYEGRSTDYVRTDRFAESQGGSQQSERRGKSLNFAPSAVNSLSNPTTTTEAVKSTTEIETTTTPPKTTQTSRRGAKKFFTRTTLADSKVTGAPFVDSPKAEARTAAQPESKGASDTRALELLRSLYTIAARWG